MFSKNIFKIRLKIENIRLLSSKKKSNNTYYYKNENIYKKSLMDQLLIRYILKNKNIYNISNTI